MQSHENNNKSSTIALIDFDNTTVFGDGDIHLNENLFIALKDLGVTDLYYLTDMSLSQDQVKDRLIAFELLKKRGFHIAMVMTPADLAWHIELSELKRYAEATSHLRQVGNPHYLTQLKSVLETRNDLRHVEALLFNPSVDAKVNVAFHEAAARVQALKTEEDKLHYTETITQKSTYANFIYRARTEETGYADGKGMLMSLFLQQKPEHINEVLFIDDKIQCIQAVEDAVQKQPHSIHLHTLHVPKEHENYSSAEYTNRIIHEMFYKFTDNLMSQLGHDYHQLGDRKHKKDIQQLQKEVKAEMNSSDKPYLILKRVVVILERALQQVLDKHRGGFLGILPSNDDNLLTFIHKMNQQPNDHHYIRLLTITLSTIYERYAQFELKNSSGLIAKMPIDKILLVDDKKGIYANRIPALIGKKPSPYPANSVDEYNKMKLSDPCINVGPQRRQ